MNVRKWPIDVVTESGGGKRYRALVTVSIRPLDGGQPARGRALVDTGANNTVIDGQVAFKSSFKSFDTGKLSSVTDVDVATPLYKIELRIIGLKRFSKQLVAVESPLSQLGVIALIGTDALEDGSFHYDAKNGEFTLELP